MSKLSRAQRPTLGRWSDDMRVLLRYILRGEQAELERTIYIGITKNEVRAEKRRLMIVIAHLHNCLHNIDSEHLAWLCNHFGLFDLLLCNIDRASERTIIRRLMQLTTLPCDVEVLRRLQGLKSHSSFEVQFWISMIALGVGSNALQQKRAEKVVPQQYFH